MKSFVKFASFFLVSYFILAQTDANAAGRIINLDKVEHNLEITFVGNSKQRITLKPNESYYLYGAWFEISLENGTPISSDPFREYIIQKNELVLMRILDTKGGSF